MAQDPVEVKKADCGHYVVVNKEAAYFEKYEVIVHTGDGARKEERTYPVTLCNYCAKQI